MSIPQIEFVYRVLNVALWQSTKMAQDIGFKTKDLLWKLTLDSLRHTGMLIQKNYRLFFFNLLILYYHWERFPIHP